MMQQICIAIDGYSSTGKSTLAKQLAKHLNYIYVDTGSMYRAVTLYAIQNDFFNEEEELIVSKLLDALPSINLSFKPIANDELPTIHLNGISVEKEIRNMKVSEKVSLIAAIPKVRRKLVEQQHKMGEHKGVVMDGRDIGTVVFPNAELKLFMTATPEVRAQRRYDELIAQGEKLTYEEVLHNVQERDRIDSTREDSPLIKAEDAIEIDNSNMNLEEQFILVNKLVQDALVKGK
ncbi:MAG TPA: (d)CMP kinase [Flavobacteriaceae bacterium]|nr:(d)CMP kinase [Flavobacteriaceae bacterium]